MRCSANARPSSRPFSTTPHSLPGKNTTTTKKIIRNKMAENRDAGWSSLARVPPVAVRASVFARTNESAKVMGGGVEVPMRIPDTQRRRRPANWTQPRKRDTEAGVAPAWAFSSRRNPPFPYQDPYYAAFGRRQNGIAFSFFLVCLLCLPLLRLPLPLNPAT